MTRTTAIAMTLLLVLLVVAVYPRFKPEPTVDVDPALFVPVVVTPLPSDQGSPPAPIADKDEGGPEEYVPPEKPNDSPGQSKDDAGFLPPQPPIPPTNPKIEKPGGSGGFTTQKPTLAVITQVNCPPCEALKKLLASPDILDAYEVKIYLAEQPGIIELTGATRFPTSIVYAGNWAVNRKVGFADAREYRAWLDSTWERGRR